MMASSPTRLITTWLVVRIPVVRDWAANAHGKSKESYEYSKAGSLSSLVCGPLPRGAFDMFGSVGHVREYQ